MPTRAPCCSSCSRAAPGACNGRHPRCVRRRRPSARRSRSPRPCLLRSSRTGPSSPGRPRGLHRPQPQRQP
eukprot:3423660-Alexandrium_andersonii.AAC.1